MGTVDIIIPVFGNGAVWGDLDYEKWRDFRERAKESVYRQTVPPQHIWCAPNQHVTTLSEARNVPALKSTADWLIFLDADDELDPHYIEEMLKYPESDLHQPSTLGIVDGVEDDYPVLIPPKPHLLEGNHLVIGTMIRRTLFEKVGGFRELPVLEDWDLWIRCAIAGASISEKPKAIYRVHVNPNSRNSEANGHGRIYTEIQNEYRGQL